MEMNEKARIKKISTIEVPVPSELELIAKERGVPEDKLIRALQRLLILEATVMNSELEMEEALRLSKKVGRGIWESLV